MKELLQGSAGNSEMRILLALDPWRSSLLTVAGDKAGRRGGVGIGRPSLRAEQLGEGPIEQQKARLLGQMRARRLGGTRRRRGSPQRQVAEATGGNGQSVITARIEASG